MNKPNRPPKDHRNPRPPARRSPQGHPATPPPALSPIMERLQALFDAERSSRRLYRELGRSDHDAVLLAVGDAVKMALREQDEREAAVRLTACAQVLAQFSGDQMVDLLIDILGSEVEEARQIAGEILSELSFARFKEVALGIERAVVRLHSESPARMELPFILLEIPEPGVVKLMGILLQQKDAQAVSAAIEACAERGDPDLLPALEALRSDQRQVEIEDDEGELDQIVLGQLASEACDMIRSEE